MRYCRRQILLFAVANLLIVSLAGCAAIKEGAKGFLGISTKVLEDNRKTALTKNFNYDYFSCYTTCLDVLKRLEAHVYAQDINRHMIAIYLSSEDTTPVGLFFAEIDKNNTRVEISSPSTFAKEFISGKVFGVLGKTITLEEIEEEIRVQKTKKQQEEENLEDK